MEAPPVNNVAQSRMSNEYMLQLHKKLTEKTYGDPPRNLSDTTASAYIKTLTILNGKKPFKNLSFLKKVEDISTVLGAYAESTQKTLLATIVSVLDLEKDKAGYKKVYKFYHDKMMEKSNIAKKQDTSEATETQKENWVEWKDVEAKREELKKATDEFVNNKTLTATHWNTLLSYLVLSLYTEVQPRRNQDYLDMVVKHIPKVHKKNTVENLPKDKNYLVVIGKVPTTFVFNKYKTQKTYGTQTITIPERLREVISLYLKFLSKGQEALLVTQAGEPITATNAITRILNKVFGKKIGSSMLRHIYLSSKYDITDMKEDANAMGHSLEEQKAYLKTT